MVVCQGNIGHVGRGAGDRAGSRGDVDARVQEPLEPGTVFLHIARNDALLPEEAQGVYYWKFNNHVTTK